MSETEAKGSGWVLPSADRWLDRSAQKSGSPAPAAMEAPSSSSSKPSVLIVEDDRSARKAISAILKRRGFTVAEAATVADAMQHVESQPQWILLDLMLPDGCGLEVLRHVRSHHIASRICIITGCCAELLSD